LSLAPFNQIWAKMNTVWSHGTTSTTAKLFHIIHIGPMSDVRLRGVYFVTGFCVYCCLCFATFRD
jgi:hypothetical protein